MCGIFTSPDKDRFFNELFFKNMVRGNSEHYSVTLLNEEAENITIFRSMPSVPISKFIISINRHITAHAGGRYYLIGHHLAPTSVHSNFHPAQVEDTYLWHNGMIKEALMEKLKIKYKADPQNEWDTKLFLRYIVDNKGKEDILDNIEGSFACLMARGDGMAVFRNELVNLFFNPETREFSSVELKGFIQIPANTIFSFLPFDNGPELGLRFINKFSTKDNPFLFVRKEEEESNDNQRTYH